MNDVQRKVFGMFKQFSDICNKLDLKYFLVNGSALGAKKYGGFISWDDDLDVAMPRKDYEIFLAKAAEYLPDNMFLQNYRTDPAFPFVYSKLRDLDTTFIEESVKNIDMNHGIYMDIFPLDSCNSESGIFSKIKAFRIKILNWFHFCALDDKSSFKIRVRNSVLRALGFHKRTAESLRKIEKLVSDSSDDTVYLCNYSDRQGKGRILREWYGEGTKAEFEGIQVVIPEKIDDYLTKKYGEWRRELPESEQKSHHKAFLCDTEKPFTEFVNY